MPFELRDFHDLVQLLREHPDWREELRTLLLTQELLTLPILVRELAEGQMRLTETVAQLTVRLDQLTARVDQLTEPVDQLTERVDQLTVRLDQLTETVARLAEAQERLGVQMGEVRGWALEQRYRTHAPAYFGRLLRQIQSVDLGGLAEALREQLGERELEEVLLTDLILTGRLPTPARPSQVWVVLEVSATVDRGDVERAQRRATVLRQARYAAVAVAGGTDATAGARQAASEAGVALLLDGRIDGWQEALDRLVAEGGAEPS
jgi:hypothetical protein